MSLRMGGVTIDCAEPRALAEFWSNALGTPIGDDFDGEYVMLDRTPYVAFQKVPEHKAGKNRVHLDFATEDRAAEVSRLVGLGATEVAEHSVPGLNWTVLRDPEDNEFCVGSEHG